MKISEKWLREWVDPEITTDQLADQLTMAGLEVEFIVRVKADFSGVVVAEIISVEPHPESGNLKLCRVNTGDKTTNNVVTGADNVREGMRVALARTGARLPNNNVIEKIDIRNISSCGMLCSAVELGLADEADGLLELPDNLFPGKDLCEFISARDAVFEISLTPNRGDCLSVHGIAREVAVLNRCDLNGPEIPAVKATISSERKIRLDAAHACPHYVGRKIEGININRVIPLWMVERLYRAGLRTINPVVDITNYVMLELGQPMHAFDDNILRGGIHIRYARENEYLLLLDNQQVKLSGADLVIADDRQALAMAGIMGGADSAVNDKTRKIFLESACFDPRTISDQSRRYNLHTDSSHRFERGVDYTLQRIAIERATQLILEICGGEAGPVIEKSVRKHIPVRNRVELYQSEIRRLLGIELSDAEITRILQALGMQVKQKKNKWSVLPPAFRYDIEIEADLIEEIARIHGYDSIPEQHPMGDMVFHANHFQHNLVQKICTVLINRGYQEAITYSFVDKTLQDMVNPGSTDVELSNPIAADMSSMRTSLWPGLIRSLQFNINRQQQHVRLFETGLIFNVEEGKILQKPAIGGLIYGKLLNKQWDSNDTYSDYYDIKRDVEEILARNRIAVAELIFRKSRHAALHPGRSSEIRYKNQLIGYIGALHPVIQRALELANEIYVFELYVERISIQKATKFQKISKFPAVKRDLAIVVDENVAFDQVLNCIRETAPDSLVNLQLFDVYRGEGIDLGKKSLAFDLTFQGSSSTLTDEEVDITMGKILSRLKSELGGVLRE